MDRKELKSEYQYVSDWQRKRLKKKIRFMRELDGKLSLQMSNTSKLRVLLSQKIRGEQLEAVLINVAVVKTTTTFFL